MLANAAARAVSGRGAPSAFRIASCLRSRSVHEASSSPKATDNAQQHGEPTADEPGLRDTQPPPKKGPYRHNRVWGPNMLLGRAAHRRIHEQQQQQKSQQQRSLFTWTQQRNFASKSPRPPPRFEQEAPKIPQAQEPNTQSDKSQPSPEFRSKLRQDSESPLSASEEAPIEPETPPPHPTGPLPDLRQGIPSTLDAHTSDATSSFKDKDAASPGLNLTADPVSSRGRKDDDGPKEEYVSSIERRRNAIAYYMFIMAGVFGGAGGLYLGRDWDNEAEAKAHPDAPNGYTPTAMYNRVTERLRNFFGYYTEPAFERLLPDPPADPNLRAPYTLVLSLEDLLVSSKWDRSNGYTVAKRPGVDYFLRYMSQYYELVVFTTVLPMNADAVLRKLDPFRFCIPLFRDATRYMEGEHVKDLSYLNRDLSKTIIIDTVPAHVKLQPENAIVLPKWKGELQDPHRGDLVALIPFLEYIASMSIEDVRKVLKSYEGTHIPTEFHRREAKARDEFNKRLSDEKAKRPRGGMGLGGLSSKLGFKPAGGMMTVPGEQTPFEGFAEGKMLSDQMRERGQRAYQEMEKQLRENGEMWLKQQEEEEKKLQEEATRNMTGWLPFFGGRGSPAGGDADKKD